MTKVFYGNFMFKWIEAVHIISVVCWMAGLLYLPRLYVYHSSNTLDQKVNSLFKIMERRLLFIICIPAMVSTVVSGLILASMLDMYGALWLHLKFIAIASLIFCTYLCYRHYINFKFDKNKRPDRYFRIFNEIVTIFMALAVIMAVVKP